MGKGPCPAGARGEGIIGQFLQAEGKIVGQLGVQRTGDERGDQEGNAGFDQKPDAGRLGGEERTNRKGKHR